MGSPSCPSFSIDHAEKIKVLDPTTPTGVKYNGLKVEGIEWMKEKQRIVEEASSVLVVGVVLWVFVSFRRSTHRTMDIDDEPQNSQRT